ncbi:YbaB/EbfC family DNA-binding protein [Allosaccharopolyspora coralli]|uniref:YbaB/EbfC family DNA-binding protein n=1 Tax=Allosaccharopolyspora coralli TaxID=2665642 RepID=A0A5Q3Q9D9_9PSEU|nr:YbaB/EbfC family nucleoid-associated protein [Allosaccharopolyspora coralli]QGK71311.1 YbaB/EbfC family DNA-binding protein [Allosaccharopolyspora coralli]
MTTDPDAMLAGWRQQIDQKMQQAQQLQDAAKAVQVSQTSRDGVVTVTVDHTGNLVGLDLADAVLRKRPAEISGEVLDTLRQAQSKLAERMRDVMQPVTGDDSDTLEAVVTGFRERFPEAENDTAPTCHPAPADDEDDEDGSWMDRRRGF